MSPSHLIGVLCAITAALSWGIGDFSGGLATRKNNMFQVLVLVSSVGLVTFIILALVKGETIPSTRNILWAAGAGLSGAIGIAFLYQGLSQGNIVIVAPTAAVIGAGIPVLIGVLLQGFPDHLQLAGFLLGILGIWLVTGSSPSVSVGKKQGLFFGVVAGVGFGGFFVLIAQVESGALFAPLAIAKGFSLITALFLLAIRRIRLPSVTGNLTAVMAGLLDAGGNLFYLLSSQFTRLDVAAVLSCMAPAITVLLANRLLHEKVLGIQWLGVALCATAVALIAI